MRARSLLVLLACLTFAPLAVAQAPAAQLDRAAIDTLKEVHDLGAKLYNAGDGPGCLRLYEGALRTAKGFLVHRPKVQSDIQKALDAMTATTGEREQAFELHKVIERVRTDLKLAEKAEAKAVPAPASMIPTPTPKPDAKPAPVPVPTPVPEPEPTPAPKVEMKPAPKPTEKPIPEPKPTEKTIPEPKPVPKATAGVSGRVTLDGAPLPEAEVMFVSVDQSRPRVFFVATDAQGKFALKTPAPDGEYRVAISGAKVPAKYATVGASPLTVAIKGGNLDAGFQLVSK